MNEEERESAKGEEEKKKYKRAVSGEDKVNSGHGNRKDRVVGRTRSPRRSKMLVSTQMNECRRRSWKNTLKRSE